MTNERKYDVILVADLPRSDLDRGELIFMSLFTIYDNAIYYFNYTVVKACYVFLEIDLVAT